MANFIFQMLKFPKLDLFATRFNHKLSSYVSPFPDNHTLAIDALSKKLGVIKKSIRDKMFSKTLQILSQNQNEHLLRKSLMQKYKTGNRIGSNPVLSELVRSFELQRPVQRSVTPKWDLSWVLVCLQKAPTEPLHKSSKLQVTIKTAFLLALATAKRCSKIHALAMDANHLRFNQSNGSVSLIVQTGFLAKNQLPSICPDPIVIPSLARTCKRDHLGRLLCLIRVFGSYQAIN